MISEGHTLTSTGVLHYQVQSLLCLYYLKELDCRRRGKSTQWVRGRGRQGKKRKCNWSTKEGEAVKKNQSGQWKLKREMETAQIIFMHMRLRYTWTWCVRLIWSCCWGATWGLQLSTTYLCWGDSASSWSSLPGRAAKDNRLPCHTCSFSLFTTSDGQMCTFLNK